MSRFFFLAFLVCSAVLQVRPTFGVGENTDVSDLVVREKTELARNGLSPEEAIRQESQRREAAETRVQKIRNLPPQTIAAWITSDQSDATLDQLSAVPASSAVPAVSRDTVSFPVAHIVRLLITIAAVLVLGFAFARHRQTQPSPPKRFSDRTHH